MDDTLGIIWKHRRASGFIGIPAIEVQGYVQI